MSNLNIVNIVPTNSRTINAKFSDPVTPLLGTENVVVTSTVSGVPDPKVLGIYVNENIVLVYTLPLTPYAKYTITFQSTPNLKVQDSSGTKFLLEDGIYNVSKFIGPEDPDNPIRDILVSNLQQNVYDLTPGTLVRTILDQLATNFSKVNHDIYQAKNENYLTLLIQDEQKTRGFGPWDRLNQEGAYEVIRVGLTETNANLPGAITFTSFPRDPITLQGVTVQNETLTFGSGSGTYDKQTLTVKNNPVTRLTSVQINYSNGSSFVYNINQYGYRILNAKYDSTYGRPYSLLSDNQFELSDDLFDLPTFVAPGGNDTIVVTYEYKLLSRIVTEDSVTVTQVLSAVREPAPAEATLFSIKNAPVVTSAGKDVTSAGIQFLDPYSTTPFRSTHPAFLYEIPYREGGLPKLPGQYAVDYTTGRVFVYGAQNNDGTGFFPPAMTYYYKDTFVSKLDYTYVPDQYDLVASPLRELIGQTATISFNYDQVLTPGVDYDATVHQEVLNERIGNRLISSNTLVVANAPVTDVFRIYNETTGEIYNATRFSFNKISFSYNKSPRIFDTTRERASFQDVTSESLVLAKEFLSTSGYRIFKFVLNNNKIVSGTEDLIGSSYNTSAFFSRQDVFAQEVYYDSQELTETINVARLVIGQYQINYQDGVVYVAVSPAQTPSVGTISYKKLAVSPANPHVISVSNIYYSINQNTGVSKQLDYSGFDDGVIYPSEYDLSDERFTNKNTLAPYIYDTGTITVTDDIKALRGVYDAYDLNNSVIPTNFAENATFSANVITLSPQGIMKSGQFIVSGALTITVPYLSPGIVLGSVFSVIRITDNQQLVAGASVNTNTITLSPSSGVVAGDVVNVIYYVVMNGAATPVVDYNKGEYYIDYTYLADEILVSYEYGDNVIDFRQNETVSPGSTYYVSYRVGALRNALLNNFAALIKIPELQAFDSYLDREVYRDILIGALQTFTKGPTNPAFKQLVSSVTKIEPQITEDLFNAWSLGVSYLKPNGTSVSGTPQLTVGKYDQGLAIRKTGDAVSFPVSNNLRLEEGTLEMWVIPDWDGVDNDASITFSVLKNSLPITSSSVFIGSRSYNPEIIDGSFTLNRNDSNSPEGLPSAIFLNNSGLFIYYDKDNKQWKMLAKEPMGSAASYTGSLTSTGEFYNVGFIPGVGELDDVLRSSSQTLDFEFNFSPSDPQDGYDGYVDGYVTGYKFDGIQLMSDNDHYIFDFGKTENTNRFSLYKDGRGYIVFEVWDRGGFSNGVKPERRNVYRVSSDIRDWTAGSSHHVAVSWILNSSDRRDEMHLYIDGFETPNIMRYGNIPDIASTNRFRTIVPEQVLGIVPKNTIAGNDLQIFTGSNVVESASVDFQAGGILPGDLIELQEQGLGTYTITYVSGNQLTISSIMPFTLSDARFSVNPTSFVVYTEIDIYKNIAVFISTGPNDPGTEIPGVRANIPGYSIERNTLNQRILKILGDANAGDTVLIKPLGLNHRRCRERLYLWNDQSIIKTALPPPINLDDVVLRPVQLPLTPIGPSNATIIGMDFDITFTSVSQPSNPLEGRHLEVRITGENTSFTTPTVVTINGTSTGGVTETLTFTSAVKQSTSYKWQTITSVHVVTTPIVLTQNCVSIEIKELYSVTNPDGNTIYPVIRFAFKTQGGLSLSGSGTTLVTDVNGYFADSDVGNLLEITAPPAVAGLYEIVQKIDNYNVVLNIPTPTSFTNGKYSIYNISIGRSGFQNGFMFFERAGFTNVPFYIPQGYFDIDFAAWLEVPFDPIDQTAYIGNDITLQKPANAVIDEFRILNYQLTDTRVGETVDVQSITTNAVEFAPFTNDPQTLTLLHFEQLPPINDTEFYIYATKEYVQSATSVNSKFGTCIVIKDKGLVFDNDGTLNTSSDGMVEFWVSPRFDTYNDPIPRVYFDAAASIVENNTSLTKEIVKVSGKINKVLSVKMANDSVTDYYGGGVIGPDRQTIYLNKPLPFQQSPVVITYVSTGTQGDRLTIYKDRDGFINLSVLAGGSLFETRQPVFWPRDTWHRVRASFKFNRSDHKDEIRLFVDGEEKGILMFGAPNVLFGEGTSFGQNYTGVTNQKLVADINFLDTINQFSIGQDFTGNYGAQARFDNIKISNRSIDPLLVGNQPKDVYFNTNSDFIYPSISDAFTTFLMDFDQLVQKNTDFAMVIDPVSGIFNFTLNIIDSFDIVIDNSKVQNILEAMIKVLKPAVSKVQINYIK
jgi:hypothetical protein